ncbi:hypothetical protein [Streptomyces sp. NPDC006334]|uniref:hypothetical protein n=1 Tax=Streptomyces sp. NPDC006334 TaxID=3156754 RepID=UPI0033B5AF2A
MHRTPVGRTRLLIRRAAASPAVTARVHDDGRRRALKGAPAAMSSYTDGALLTPP